MIRTLVFLISAFLASIAYASTSVNVVGLFSGKVVVMINGGAPQTISVGQTKQGVKLLRADSQKATLVVEGETKVLSMGQAASIAGPATASDNQAVQLYADVTGHFFGNLTVNYTPLRYVVDTGATKVAMSSADAKRAGINYLNGKKTNVSTASGLATAYNITINTLKIGAITLHNVPAAVIEGRFPEVVLLGMTALNRLEMTRENAVLTLTKKY